jgi:hypothetical protein
MATTVVRKLSLHLLLKIPNKPQGIREVKPRPA